MFLGCNKFMLNFKIENKVGYIILNRPELHNAFNEELITLLTNKISEFDNSNEVRIIVLSGEGQSFCAGADLNWMKKMKNYSEEENFKDSLNLSKLFQVLNNCKKPVIGKINGHALGGGVGLVSCCDYVISSSEAMFGLTEVRLGLIPAVISPFVMAKMGESNARAYFMSGERFVATKAMQMNLVHEVVDKSLLDEATDKIIKSFLLAGPKAQIIAKNLIFENKRQSSEKVYEYTCKLIAKTRNSDEGQEGMNALLEKRKANWV